MSNKDIKVIAKMAFAIGMGLQVGKYVGACINGVLEGVQLGIMVVCAESGNTRAMHYCDTHNVYYEKKDTNNQ